MERPAIRVTAVALTAWLALHPASGRAQDEVSASASEVPRLTLADAVGQALERNDRLLGVRDSLAQAELSLRLARSQFRPKITPNILGSFGQSDVSNQTYRVDLSQKLMTGTELRATAGTFSERNQIGTFYNTDTTLEISQPLLRGFGRNVARRGLYSAETRLADVMRERALSEQRVAIEVASAYYRIVGQKQMLAIARKTVERSQALLAASQAKLEVGKVSQLDVFRARQLVAQAEGQLLDSEGAVEDAMDQMRILLRRGPEYAFEVEEHIPVVRLEVDGERAVETALGARLEITSATESLSEAERAVAASRNQLLPQFDLNLALTRREVAPSLRRSFGLDRFDVATFFAISMPVDRAPQTIEYHSLMIERDRRRREIDALRMRVVEEVRRAVRQSRRLVKALEVADVSVEFAEKELDVATLRYQRGFSNNLDVVNAEEGLLSARARRIGLLAEMAVARLSLRAALGTLDPRRDVLAAAGAAGSTAASEVGSGREDGTQRAQ